MSAGVLVGYDGSNCGKAALRAGIEVGRAYGEPVIVAFAYELNPVGGEMRDYQLALEELAAGRLGEATAIAAELGGSVEAVSLQRNPAQGLAELAQERDARVIVVGSRGESPIRGALLGSTPHKLLQLAGRPVLVVPADD